MQIETNKSLQDLNSFGFNVRAEYYFNVNNIDDLLEALAWSRKHGHSNVILGGGSNTVFTRNVSGLVLHINIDLFSVVDTEKTHSAIKVGAGCNWHTLVVDTLDQNYFGLENLAMIPGCVGAAPIQNIGAYGTEVCNVLTSVETLHQHTGEQITICANDCAFAYRHSIFKTNKGKDFIITGINLRLSKKDKPVVNYKSLQDELLFRQVEKVTAKDVFNCVCDLRNSKLPNPKVVGNAGSFFKNPVIDRQQLDAILNTYPSAPVFNISDDNIKIPAAWLIEQAGWKGHRSGHVGVHDQQALVLVNHGGGTGKQIAVLANAIQSDIREKFNIELEREPVYY